MEKSRGMDRAQIKKTIADRLKNARVAAGYSSIEDFCLKNNLNVSEYQNHENGVKSIKASRALRYCDLLGISIQELMIGEIFAQK